MRAKGILCLLVMLSAAQARAQWCEPGVGPTQLNTYGPTSPVITNVKLNTIDRITPASVKELYVLTGLTTELTNGATYDFSMTYEPDLAFCPQYAIRVWIDWDQNGDFTEPGETVVSANFFTPATITESFVVPTSALAGTTRMRVAMKMEEACGHAAIEPCALPESFGWHGEIEDYDIDVVGGGPACNPVPVALLQAVRSAIDVELSWEENPTFVSYNVYGVVSLDPSLIPLADGEGMVTYPTDIERICLEVLSPCLDVGRITLAPELVYYQTVGVCANGDEGPVE